MKTKLDSIMSDNSVNKWPGQSRPFSDNERADRLNRVRAVMSEKEIDAALVFSPENIYYLTGLDHQGFFSPHILVVPKKGDMQLILRAMEEATCRSQIDNARFQGHSDAETPAEKAIQVIKKMGLAHYRRHHCGYMVGVGFPPSWVGGSGVVGLRHRSNQVLTTGMSFHLLSWLVGSGIGDYLITDTVILNSTGGQSLRQFPVSPQVL
jgi:Xaa-Pro aminopeptidase